MRLSSSLAMLAQVWSAFGLYPSKSAARRVTELVATFSRSDQRPFTWVSSSDSTESRRGVRYVILRRKLLVNLASEESTEVVDASTRWGDGYGSVDDKRGRLGSISEKRSDPAS